jgi:hypothetical protein
MFPKGLGIILVDGGVFYLVDMLSKFLVPDFAAMVTSFRPFSERPFRNVEAPRLGTSCLSQRLVNTFCRT